MISVQSNPKELTENNQGKKSTYQGKFCKKKNIMNNRH